MPAPVCLNCNLEYKLKKSGVFAVEHFSQPPRPYKIWSADLHQCPGCGHKILKGYGSHCMAEHFQPKFQEMLDQLPPERSFNIFEN